VQASSSLGRTADRAVEESCADHRGQATPPANSQLRTHDRISGTHRLTDLDRRGLTPLFWSNVNPYGRFTLDMDTHLDLGLTAPAVTAPTTSVGTMEGP
jgi:hypothetical protein